MKSIKMTLSMLSFGLLLGMAACNSNKNGDNTSGSMDSTSMDNTQTQMQTDSMITDSVSKPL
jgi:hypothetical protein